MSARDAKRPDLSPLALTIGALLGFARGYSFGRAEDHHAEAYNAGYAIGYRSGYCARGTLEDDCP